MSSRWYYVNGGSRFGPFTPEELKKAAIGGKLTLDDLVWKEGMQDWAPAKRLKGLFPEKPIADSLLPASTQPPPVPVGAHKVPTTPNAPSGSDASRGSFWTNAIEGGKIAPAIAILFGFVGDFLRPLGPINGYLFVATFIATIVLIVMWLNEPFSSRYLWDRLVPHRMLLFCGFLMSAFGLWFLLEQIAGAEERGVVAAKIPAVATLQGSLLNLRQDIAGVRQDTQAILGETQKIGVNLGGLGKLGGLIKDPKTPADYYHNARVHELGGNFSGAFESYEKYLESNQHFVDPIQSYLSLLEQQRGHAAAVRTFDTLRQRFPDNVALELVSCGLQSGPEKEASLNQFVQVHPQFAPAYIELANLFSAEQMPNRSNIHAESEQSYLRRAIALADEGSFLQWYLDKKFAGTLLQQVRGRLTAGANSGIVDVAAQVQFHVINGSLVVMDRQAKVIYYSYDGANWKEGASFAIAGGLMKWGTAAVDHEEWLARVLPILKGDQSGEHLIYIKYRDSSNRESRIYEIPYLQDVLDNKALLRNEFGNRGVRFNDGGDGPFEALDKGRRAMSEGRRSADDAKRRVDEIMKDVEKRRSP